VQPLEHGHVDGCPFPCKQLHSCIIELRRFASSGAAVLLRQVGFRNASECNEFSVSRCDFMRDDALPSRGRGATSCCKSVFERLSLPLLGRSLRVRLLRHPWVTLR